MGVTTAIHTLQIGLMTSSKMGCSASPSSSHNEWASSRPASVIQPHVPPPRNVRFFRLRVSVIMFDKKGRLYAIDVDDTACCTLACHFNRHYFYADYHAVDCRHPRLLIRQSGRRWLCDLSPHRGAVI